MVRFKLLNSNPDFPRVTALRGVKTSQSFQKSFIKECTLNHTIPYYTILYYTILYYTIPYYTGYTILYHTIPYHIIPYYTILYHTTPYYTILYHTIPYYTILYYTQPPSIRGGKAPGCSSGPSPSGFLPGAAESQTVPLGAPRKALGSL